MRLSSRRRQPGHYLDGWLGLPSNAATGLYFAGLCSCVFEAACLPCWAHGMLERQGSSTLHVWWPPLQPGVNAEDLQSWTAINYVWNPCRQGQYPLVSFLAPNLKAYAYVLFVVLWQPLGPRTTQLLIVAKLQSLASNVDAMTDVAGVLPEWLLELWLPGVSMLLQVPCKHALYALAAANRTSRKCVLASLRGGMLQHMPTGRQLWSTDLLQGSVQPC